MEQNICKANNNVVYSKTVNKISKKINKLCVIIRD